MSLLEKLKREKGVFDYISILNAVECIAYIENVPQKDIANSLIIMDAKNLDFYQMNKESEFRIYQDHPYSISDVRYSDELLTTIRNGNSEKIRSSRIKSPYWKIDDLLKLIDFSPDKTQKLIELFEQANLNSHIEAENSKANLLVEERLEMIEKLKTENALLKQQLNELQSTQPNDEGQGDTLLILGAVMYCIKDIAKPNYTQQLLIHNILQKYDSVSGISESTLTKKFPIAKEYLKQRLN